MLCALPFGPKDVHAERVLLNWIAHLGGCKGHQALLVADAAVPWDEGLELLELASRAFSEASMVATDDPQEGWPQAPNWMFRACAAEAKRRQRPFLWLEPDAIPLKPGWLDELDRQYSKSGTSFFGSVSTCEKPGLPSRYLAGNAIYPANAIDIIGPALDARPHVAWDVCSADAVVPRAGHTNLIQHIWGEASLPPTFAQTRANNGPRNVLTLSDLWRDALIFHRCKDGSLIRLLGGEAPHRVAHGGDVGDLVYGLAAMKVMGECHLVVHWHPVREAFTLAKFNRILPLLELQPYLPQVTFQHEKPSDAVDFNKFRQWNWDRRMKRLESLAQSHLRVFNLPEHVLQEPWLAIDEPVRIPRKQVIFHRSPRYHNNLFPWKNIWAAYSSHAVFVGMPAEYQNFCREVGYVDYYPTADYLELARVIAGSTLFVGNQSSPYAIAEAMKKNAILEAMPGCADCQFHRPNLQNDTRGRIHVHPLEEYEKCVLR